MKNENRFYVYAYLDPRKPGLQRTKMVSVSTENRNHHKQLRCVKINN